MLPPAASLPLMAPGDGCGRWMCCLVGGSYCRMMSAPIRPRSETFRPAALAQARVLAAPGRRPAWLRRRQAVLGKPGSELVRGTDSVVDHGGVDLQATDLMRVGGPKVPVVFDAQHRAALFGGDALAQFFVPARDVW